MKNHNEKKSEIRWQNSELEINEEIISEIKDKLKGTQKLINTKNKALRNMWKKKIIKNEKGIMKELKGLEKKWQYWS